MIMGIFLRQKAQRRIDNNFKEDIKSQKSFQHVLMGVVDIHATDSILTREAFDLLRYNINPPKLLEAEIEGGKLILEPLQVENTRFYLIFFTKEQLFLDKLNKFLPRLTEDLSSLIKYVVTFL